MPGGQLIIGVRRQDMGIDHTRSRKADADGFLEVPASCFLNPQKFMLSLQIHYNKWPFSPDPPNPR